MIDVISDIMVNWSFHVWVLQVWLGAVWL